MPQTGWSPSLLRRAGLVIPAGHLQANPAGAAPCRSSGKEPKDDLRRVPSSHPQLSPQDKSCPYRGVSIHSRKSLPGNVSP